MEVDPPVAPARAARTAPMPTHPRRSPTPRTRALIALLAALCLAPAPAPAAAAGLHGLWARDGLDAIAVGDSGAAWRTLDGGVTWSAATIGAPGLALRDVAGRGLAMLAVGDAGQLVASDDGGGHWSAATAPGAPALFAAAIPSDSVSVAGGAQGALLRSTDAGAHWDAIASGTAQTLRALRFTDAAHGWALGDAGTLLATADAGASWTPVPVPTTATLRAIDRVGAVVWVTGDDGVALRSTDGGATFAPVALGLDARADVRGVAMLSADTLWLAGGGGFVRGTTDGGAHWSYPVQPLQAPITRLVAAGGTLYATNAANRAVLTSANRGATWRLPAGATVTRGWGNARFGASGAVRGNGFAIDPVSKSTLYCGLGAQVARSRDDGDTWQVAATFPMGYTKCNAFAVSAHDSNTWLAAIGGISVKDRIARTTDGGVSWTLSLEKDFGEYGVPLEVDPDHPDTVLFGGEQSSTGTPSSPLWRSTDFGATWDSLPAALFRSPCDLLVVPGQSNVVIVGDGVTGSGKGQFLKSTDGGQTFALKYTVMSSEVPELATSRLRPGTIFATNWSTGGVQRSTDGGETWPVASSVSQAWGLDVCRDDPNFVVFGQYNSPFNTVWSLDGGTTWNTLAPPAGFGLNYAFLARDRATLLAEQSGGIWKLAVNYGVAPVTPAQSLALAAPDGGETWAAGTTHDVTWSAAGIAFVRIEWQDAPGAPWQRVADVPGAAGRCAWRVPGDATAAARVRVRDLWDAAPADSSAGAFTILASRFEASPDTVALPAVAAGVETGGVITLANTGNAPVTVTAIAVSNPEFWTGRGTLVLAPGATDTLGVYCVPSAAGADSATLTFATDDADGAHAALVTATATPPLAAPPGVATAAFALQQNRPNPFTGSTVIRYALPVAAPVRLEMFDLRGERVATLVDAWQPPGWHDVTLAASGGAGARRGLAAGVYFYRLRAGALTATRKLLVLP